MLEVGVRNLTATENRAHFSLWCMLSAPLILGCDVRRFVSADAAGGIDRNANNGAYDIITNRELIALDQDALMLQCKRVADTGGIDILIKPLWGGEAAVLFLNKNEKPAAAAELNLARLHKEDARVTLLPAEEYFVKDLWGEAGFCRQGAALFSGEIPPHGATVFRIKNISY
jgi:alpha-galactosidase